MIEVLITIRIFLQLLAVNWVNCDSLTWLLFVIRFLLLYACLLQLIIYCNNAPVKG